jgi:hypothetical protein
MRFLKRYRFFLLCLAVLICASILVVQQFLAAETAHFTLREDMIVLFEKGKTAEAEHVYQRLVEELSGVSDKILVDDYQRTALLLQGKEQNVSSLVYKYHWAVKQYLEKRSEQRLASALQRVATKE